MSTNKLFADMLQKDADAKAKAKERMIGAARIYAAADRTDPFTLRRAITHIENGVAQAHRPANKEYSIDAGGAYYAAERFREARKIVGYDGKEQTYDVLVYRNVVRP